MGSPSRRIGMAVLSLVLISPSPSEKVVWGKAYSNAEETSINCYHCNLFLDITDGGLESSSSSAEVVNGVPAKVGQFIWVASLNRRFTDRGWDTLCGSAIYDAFHIITASHCVVGSVPSQLKVVAGTVHAMNNGEVSGQESMVDKICTHPSYNPGSGKHGFDIAVLRLKEPFTFGTNVRKANISWVKTKDYGPTGFVAGWGLTFNETGTGLIVPKVLQSATVRVYPPEKHCTGYRGNYNDIICAGTDKQDITNGKPPSVCFGDSGGPIQCSINNESYEACGILSLGQRDCKATNQEGNLGIFVKLASYRDWIQRVADKGDTSQCK